MSSNRQIRQLFVPALQQIERKRDPSRVSTLDRLDDRLLGLLVSNALPKTLEIDRALGERRSHLADVKPLSFTEDEKPGAPEHEPDASDPMNVLRLVQRECGEHDPHDSRETGSHAITHGIGKRPADFPFLRGQRQPGQLDRWLIDGKSYASLHQPHRGQDREQRYRKSRVAEHRAKTEQQYQRQDRRAPRRRRSCGAATT